MKHVRIGNKMVPVMDGKTIAVFTAGRAGPSEAGSYYFWTACCVHKRDMATITARALVKLDAGERFRRMGYERKSELLNAATRREYEKMWQQLRSIAFVRPAYQIEVAAWMSSHQPDACYLRSLKFS